MPQYISNAIVWDGKPTVVSEEKKTDRSDVSTRSSKTWKKKFVNAQKRKVYMREAKRKSREKLRSADPSYGRSKDSDNPRSFLYRLKSRKSHESNALVRGN
jgi:hypothetical protein